MAPAQGQHTHDEMVECSGNLECGWGMAKVDLGCGNREKVGGWRWILVCGNRGKVEVDFGVWE